MNKMSGSNRFVWNLFAVFLASMITPHTAAVTAPASINMTAISTGKNTTAFLAYNINFFKEKSSKCF